MTIDIGEGIEEEITVHEGDDPWKLAKQVVEKHSLNSDILKIIEDNIKQNLIIVKSSQKKEQISNKS